MTDLPWFPLWAERWRRSRKVRSVPRHIRSMYFDLLCEIWVDGPIPDGEAAVRGLLNEEPRSFRSAWPLLRPLFVEAGEGRITDAFLEVVREEQLQKNAKQAKRAKDGWVVRKGRMKSNSSGHAAASERHSGGNEISDLRSEISERERESTHARVPARVDPPPAPPSPTPPPSPVKLFSLAWGKATGELLPGSWEIGEVHRRLQEYAALCGITGERALDLALEAFRAEVKSWRVNRPLTAGLFLDKWAEVQVRMSAVKKPPTSKGYDLEEHVLKMGKLPPWKAADDDQEVG